MAVACGLQKAVRRGFYDGRGWQVRPDDTMMSGAKIWLGSQSFTFRLLEQHFHGLTTWTEGKKNFVSLPRYDYDVSGVPSMLSLYIDKGSDNPV